jgi:outer membrane murein-binding lipoprotein Lpp
MTAVLFITVWLLAVSITTLVSYMAAISTLAPRLTELQSKINAISLDVQRLKDRADQAGQIPADAQALLDNLTGTIDALAVSAAPVPAPGPLT